MVPARKLASSALLLATLAPLLFVACGDDGPPPNVVLVVLDTTRRDHTGCAADERAKSHTPHLDRLASEGICFTNAWANGPWTVPSHASMFTGALPSSHGCKSTSPELDGRYPTLAERLSEAGYRTGTFFSNPWLSNQATKMMRGFQTERIAELQEDPALGPTDQGGAASLNAVRDWLGEQPKDRPFFAFVNFLESHLPYDPPAEYRREHLSDLPADEMVSVVWSEQYRAGLIPSTEVDWNRLQRLYGGDVWMSDRLLGQLLTVLEQMGFAENTVLIVTSDHGEMLGEHQLIDHQFSVHEPLLAVPLVLHAPDRLRAARRDDPVMLLDLYATVLELARIRVATPPSHSRSLLHEPFEDDRALIAEYAGARSNLLTHLRGLNPRLNTQPLSNSYKTVRVGDWRLTMSGTRELQLHDIANDPGQLENLTTEHQQLARSMHPLLTALYAKQRSGAEPPEDMDEELKAKLRALGYN